MKKIPKLPWGYRMPIKDIQEWVMLRPKLDACGYCRCHKWMIPYKFFFLLGVIFFLFCFSFTLLSLLLCSYFYCFACLAKEIPRLKKRQGRSNLKRTLEIHHTQVTFIWIKKHEINKVWRERVVEFVEFGWYN